jgi:DNA replication and repair protein RecF
LTIWDAQLAELGSQVVCARLAGLAKLGQPLRSAYEAVAPHSQAPSAIYQSSWLPPHLAADPHPQAVTEAILAAIDEQRQAEIDRGLTLVGPHRDDVLLSIGELPAKGYASHGESWSLALALKLATFEVLKSAFDTGGDPVLVLDDVFAELDSERRERLGALVAEAEQVIVTAAVAADVPGALRGRTLSVTRDGDSQVSW